MNLWDHLDDLRRVLIRSLVALGGISIFSFILTPKLVTLLLYPAQRKMEGLSLLTIQPAEGVVVSLKLGLVFGAVLAAPYIMREIWGFVSPGLMPKEKKWLGLTFGFGTGLFFLGAAFAYFFVIPQALGFFLRANEVLGVTSSWTLQHYFGFVLMFLFAFGLAFETPLVLILLIQLGLVEAKTLAARRPYAIVIIFIVAAVLTPPDVVSQVLLALPLWGLFEISLLISRLIK